MNHKPNTIHWHRGDIVIHDADAKEPRMLMRVMGFQRNTGFTKCQYIDKRHHRKIYLQETQQSLHAPEYFGLRSEWGECSQEELKRIQRDFELVRIFNRTHRTEGYIVQTTSADGGFEARTIGLAFMSRDGNARITLTPGGNWLLRFVERASKETA